MAQAFDEHIGEASLSILSRQTINIICSKLDSHKILLSDHKYHRDWRGLAQHVDLEVSQIRSMKVSPTEYCLKLWVQKGLKIKEYWKCLEEMDRYDVIDDNYKAICDDLNNSKQCSPLQLKCLQFPLESIQNSVNIQDADILTVDDVNNIRNGGSLQFYNALILHVEQDIAFVQEMVTKLEGEYNMKICLIHRELIGGVQFEFEAVARLIQERCMRVIVVLSPAFLDSNANNFFITFAQALSIDQRRRIVIPCMLEPCRKPTVIAFCHSLDYYRTKGYWNYWEKLANSVKPTYEEIKIQMGDEQRLPYKKDNFKWPLTLADYPKDTISRDTNSLKFDISESWSSAIALSLPEPPSASLDSFSTDASTVPLVLDTKTHKSGIKKKLKKMFKSKKKTKMSEG